MAQECDTAATTECTLYNNQDQKYFTNRKISGLCTKPNWQSSLAFKQCLPCKHWGQHAGAAGLPRSWECGGTRAAMSAADGDHHHGTAALSFLSKRQGTSTLEPNDGVPTSHLTKPSVLHRRQCPSASRQLRRKQPCPQLCRALHCLPHSSAITLTANALDKV